MTVRAWVALTVILGAGVGLAAGLGTRFASPAASAWATGLTAGLLAATFLAILRYSFEMHRMVDAQQEATEIARHTWLSATTLKPQELHDEVGVYGAIDLWLPIKNEGTTPAYVTDIAVTGKPDSRNSGCTFSPRERVTNQVIVPGDLLDLRLGAILSHTPNATIYMDTEVTIRYATADGGSGMLVVGFRCDDEEFTNLDTSYMFTLSTGRRFPSTGPDFL